MSSQKKSIVLLSSGLDSTVNLMAALKKSQVVQVLTFDYGQKAAVREIASAKKMCKELELPHQVIELKWLSQITNTSLVSAEEDIPKGDEVSIDDVTASEETAARVWVPNRNGVFLNIAASFADSLGASWVVPGFNKEEAVTFPDNSSEFMSVLNQSFTFSTSNNVEVKCFTDTLDKTEIFRLAKELHAPIEDMWPCYEAQDDLCGECESCQRFFRAKAAAESAK